MDRLTFDIFEPDGKKFRWTPNTIVLIFGFIPMCLSVFFEKSIAKSELLSNLITLYAIIGGTVVIGCLIISFFLRKPLNGVMNGKIEFGTNFFDINNQKFMLNEINNLDFSFTDYYERRSTVRYDLNAKLSQGVNNYITFDDKSDRTYLIYFRLMSEHSYLALSPFISQAVKTGKMYLCRAEDLVGRENVVY